MNPKFPDIHVQLSGEDGNAYFIMARVTAAMKSAKVDASEIETYRNAAMSGDYDNLLRTTMATVSTS